MNMKQRVAMLESGGRNDSLGSILDALDDPDAMAKVRISPSLAAMLDGLQNDGPTVLAPRNQDLPL